MQGRKGFTSAKKKKREEEGGLTTLLSVTPNPAEKLGSCTRLPLALENYSRHTEDTTFCLYSDCFALEGSLTAPQVVKCFIGAPAQNCTLLFSKSGQED